MKFKALLLSFTLGLFSIMAVAGGNHGHGHSHSNTPVNQATAKIKANEIVAAFVKSNKLDKSWSSISAKSVDKKTFDGRQEWVVSFVNEKIAETDKRKLYVFLTLGGDYIAANHTGK